MGSNNLDLTKISFTEDDKLKGKSNYAVWAFLVEQVLRERDLWDLVDPQKTQNAAAASTSSDSSNTGTPDSQGGDQAQINVLDSKKRQKIVSVIASTVTRLIIPTVQRLASDPAKLWLTLKRKYQPSALQRKLDLKSELNNMKMEESSSVEDYLRNVERVRVDLAGVGVEIPDDELIEIVMGNLPESYSTFVSGFGQSHAKDSDLLFTDLEEALLTEELRRKHRASRHSSVEESLVSIGTNQKFNSRQPAPSRQNQPRQQPRRQQQQTGGRPYCNFCNKLGHREETCFVKQANQDIKTLNVSQLRSLTQAIQDLKNGESNLVEGNDIGDSDGHDEDMLQDGQSALTVEALLSEHAPMAQSWIMDSGATHITNSKSLLENISSSKIRGIVTASGSVMPTSGEGCTSISGNKISEVLYVPSVTKSLLSVGKLTDKGTLALFSSRHCYVLDAKNPSRILLHASRDPRTKLYKLPSHIADQTSLSPNRPLLHKGITASCNAAQQSSPTATSKEKIASAANSRLWHQRIGHASYDRLQFMARYKLVQGLPRVTTPHSRCDICIQAKQHRHPISKTASFRSSQPLELIHSDLCGPLPVPSLHGSRYIMTITDDFSRFTWVYFLKKKGEVFETFKHFKLHVEVKFPFKISSLRSDRGGEYTSERFNRFCHSQGIHRQLTVARTPHQNGVAERKNRTLLELVRSLSIAANIPAHLWEEMVRAGNYINNRCSTRALHQSTPFEALFRYKPDVRNFKVIGSTAFVHIPKERRDKLGSKSISAVLVGYDDQSKAYRCFDPNTQKILISRDVVIDETLPGNFVSNNDEAHSTVLDMLSSLAVEANDSTYSDDTHSIMSNEIPVNSPTIEDAVNTDTAGREVPEHPSQLLDSEYDADDRAEVPLSNNGTPELSSSTSDPMNDTPPMLQVNQKSRKPRNPKPRPPPRPPSSRIKSDPYNMMPFAMSVSPSDTDLAIALIADTPNEIRFEDAIEHPLWQKAMQDELDAHHKNGTWELVEPQDANILSAKWVLRTKIDHNNNIRYKARVVARGFEQRPGLDYDETFAPVVKWSTVRLIVALAAAFGYPLYHMDVVTAFLNGTLDELIYMLQPAGFEEPGKEHLVCKLNRSIYGLKQSPRVWYEEVDNFLRSIGCIRSKLDPNLYFTYESGHLVVLLLFVDDLLITGSNSIAIDAMKQTLSHKYEMKDLGPVKRYLGVDFHTTQEGIFLHQTSYARQILEDYQMQDCRPASTPLPEGQILSLETNTEAVDSTHYSQLVGKLIYLTTTRPDLSFAVNLISRYMSSPQHAHLTGAHHILRYLKATSDLGLYYLRNSQLKLEGFSDSDWGNSCPDMRRSVGGYVFQLSSGPITWSSKRQPTVSRSTTEAEYKALSDAAQEGVYLKRLLEELQQQSHSPTALHCNNPLVVANISAASQPTTQDLHIYCDNVSATKLARNPVFHARTKHIELHHHFVRERVLGGEITVQHISTSQQTADIFTKSLGRTKFEQHRHNIGIRSLATIGSCLDFEQGSKKRQHRK
ncbi:unnamed protein product [Calypogeia fissa]